MSLTVLIYGETGSGKTSLAMTAPQPLLFIDATGTGEYAHTFEANKATPVDMNSWSIDEPYPTKEGTYIYCPTSYEDIKNLYIRLKTDSGFKFKSIVIDTVFDVQRYLKNELSPTGNMQMKDWGQLQQLETTFKQLIDLTKTSSIETIVFICDELLDEEKPTTPLMQGSLKKTLLTWAQIVGYVRLDYRDDGNVVQQLKIRRKGAKDNKVFVKNSVPQLDELGQVIDDPNIAKMINRIRGKK